MGPCAQASPFCRQEKYHFHLKSQGYFKLKAIKNPECLEFLNRNVLHKCEVHKCYERLLFCSLTAGP